jgi:Glycosyl transferase family 2
MTVLQETHVSSAGSRTGEPCVAILLSTFNGEQYLDEQLASFVTQTHGNWLLYWRDDGSSDRTTAVMRDFTGRTGAGRVIAGPEGGRMQAARSFLTLLRLALQGPASLYAFSDQDDVWLPEKLAHGVAVLRDLPPERPALYFCARRIVDAALAPVGDVLVPGTPPGFPAALTQNVAPDCCIMLNRAAAELIDLTGVPDGAWHDWWAYIAVSACGGTILTGELPDILYRQHSGNLVGEPRGFWYRTIAALRRGPDAFMTLFWHQVAALRPAWVPLSRENRAILEVIARAEHGGLLARLRALRLPGLVRQTRSETLLFRLWLLLG